MKDYVSGTDILEFEEGYRKKPYYCSEGYPTVGIGKKLGPKGTPLNCYEFTVSKEIAKSWLEEEVTLIEHELLSYAWFKSLSENRKDIIVSMAYQMGVSGVLKFKKMIAALEVGHWEEAANQALDSRWAVQTPARANRHAEVIRSGSAKYVYGELL